MKFFNKVVWKFKEIIEKFLISIIFLSQSPKLAAFLIALTIKDVNSKGNYKILCLRRSIFMDDVVAMTKFSGKLYYVALSRNIILGLFWKFLAPEGKDYLNYQDYHSGKYYQQGIKKYYDFLTQLLPALKKRVGFDAVFSGNFVYVEQQELARVCLENNIPFVILHKEGLTTGVYKDSAELHRGCRFIGDKLMVYNHRVKQALVEQGDIVGISDNNMAVVGTPRIDYLFKENKITQPQKQVVLFSSIPKMRFSRMFQDQKFLEQLAQRAEDFDHWVMQFAQNHPDIKVVIKTKVAKYYLEHPKKIFFKYFDQDIPNLEITSAGNAGEMIRNSMAICAFNSMTQIEALIIDQPVISPYYGDLIPDQPWDYFVNHRGLVAYAKSYNELENYLLNYEELKKRDPQMKEDFLQRFIGFTDGQSSQRVENEIIKVIEQKK